MPFGTYLCGMPHPADLSIRDFSYDLPQERIAQRPLAQRDQSKLLQYQQSVISDHTFTDLPQLLPKNALLLFNNTRVVQARLLFRKESGGLIELFCLEPVLPTAEVQMAMQTTAEAQWLCLVGNNKRWKSGVLVMEHAGLQLTAERLAAQGEGYLIRFRWTPAEHTFAEILQAFGNIPLPPYLQREAEADDTKRYQTVYARFDGAVAAPTAGLHFTDAVFKALTVQGIKRQELTLHVGAGTFKPVKADTMAGHEMHREEIVVTKSLLNSLLAHQGPIIPVGTTSLRTLESLYWMGCLLQPNDPHLPEPGQFTAYETPATLTPKAALEHLLQWLEAQQLEQSITYTALMIAPGYQFRYANAIITNFHQPQSTLLLLIAAAVGTQWQHIYAHALQRDYRFLSYGDSSLLWFNTPPA